MSISVEVRRRILVERGDITHYDVDAIVNAANAALSGGGGVDGAIHRAAGPELVRASRALGPCAVGDVRITPGFNLPARYVIHAVGPVWWGGNRDEDALLASCYRRAIEVAAQHGLRTIAFPPISTGAYRFPIDRAAAIALRQIAASLAEHGTIERVTLVCFSAADVRAYRTAWESLAEYQARDA